MGIKGFDHLYIESPRFEESVAFWAALGLQVEDKWGDDGHRACRLASPALQVVLVEAAAEPVLNLHLAMTDPVATMRQLDAGLAQVAIATPLEDTHWGTRWIRLTDPDGRMFCLESPKD